MTDITKYCVIVIKYMYQGYEIVLPLFVAYYAQQPQKW